MKVISVIGVTDSGKTTTIEHIIKELVRRRYTVGTVKNIHFHDFKLDVAGTNTDRHRRAGAELVTARGERETDIMFQKQLDIHTLLRYYDQDFVILEGARDTTVPKILTAHSESGIIDRMDETVFAISGRVSSEITAYQGLPAINALTDIEALVDLIEAKAFKPLPDMKDACCKACGYTCRELSGRIIKGLSSREDCLVEKAGIRLRVGGVDVPMVPFVQKILQNAIEDVVSELQGYDKNSEIEIWIKK